MATPLKPDGARGGRAVFFRSLRWRLQAWYAAILVVLVTVFGFTAFALERSRQLRQIDGELQARVSLLASGLRPGGPPSGPRPADRPQPPGDAASEPRWRDVPPDRTGPPPPRLRDEPGPPPPRGPGGRPAGRPEFVLRPELVAAFDPNAPSPFYYLVWLRGAEVLARSQNAPDLPRPPVEGRSPRQRGDEREMFLYLATGDCVLAGRAVGPDLAELDRLAWWLFALGAGVLGAGLVGGWWIAGRAIRPIEEISAAAARIATGDLSRRIDTADAESELGRLAQVLNATFSRLEASFAQQGRFTADAAHELRTPVSVILMQAQTALSRERDPADYREALESCRQAAQRMRRLIESLLDLARLDAGEERMRRERFDLARVVHEAVDLVRPLAAERGIILRVEAGAAEALGDAERIAQVAVNLLTNAIQHTPSGGEVRTQLSSDRDGVRLAVADGGEGIPLEHLPHLFERFHRGDAARTTAEGHAGLGLAISKAIVDAHGGVIMGGNAVEGGAVFTVRLPGATAS